MKIAGASMGSNVSGHFGHCESFRVFDAENGVITAASVVPNPGHKPDSCPISWGTWALRSLLPAVWAAARWKSSTSATSK
jgi:hypothetical protein